MAAADVMSTLGLPEVGVGATTGGLSVVIEPALIE